MMPRRVSSGRSFDESAPQHRQEKPTRRITLIILVEPAEVGAWDWSSIAGKFGHRFLGAVVVDQRFAGCSRRNQGSGGGVIQRARQAQAGFVQASDRIVSELSRAWDYAE
jgi:hypothetical protein